jgi:hypothetical protein
MFKAAEAKLREKKAEYDKQQLLNKELEKKAWLVEVCTDDKFLLLETWKNKFEPPPAKNDLVAAAQNKLANKAILAVGEKMKISVVNLILEAASSLLGKAQIGLEEKAAKSQSIALTDLALTVNSFNALLLCFRFLRAPKDGEKFQLLLKTASQRAVTNVVKVVRGTQDAVGSGLNGDGLALSMATAEDSARQLALEFQTTLEQKSGAGVDGILARLDRDSEAQFLFSFQYYNLE